MNLFRLIVIVCQVYSPIIFGINKFPKMDIIMEEMNVDQTKTKSYIIEASKHIQEFDRESQDNIAKAFSSLISAEFLTDNKDSNFVPLLTEIEGLFSSLGYIDESLELRNYLAKAKFNKSEKVDPENYWQNYYSTETAKIAGYDRPDLEASLSSFLAEMYTELELTANAIQFSLKAHEQVRKIPTKLNPSLKISVLGRIAIIFNEQNLYDMATDIYNEMLDICNEFALNSDKIAIYYNLAILYLDTKSYEESEKAFKAAYELANQLKQQWPMAATSFGLAKIYMAQNKLVDSLKMSVASQKIYEELQDNDWVVEVLALKLEILIALNKIDEAERDFDKFKDLTEKSNFMSQRSKIYNIQYLIAKKLGKIPEALKHLEKSTELNKEKLEKGNKTNFAKLLVDLGLSREQERNDHLAELNREQEKYLKVLETEKTLYLSILTLCFAILGLGVFAAKKALDIRRSKIKLQKIFDHVDEGICTINHYLKIDPGESKFFKILFPLEDIKTKTIGQILEASKFIGSEQKAIIESVLSSSIGEDSIGWDLNSPNLPVRLNSDDRHILLSWLPIADLNKSVRQILLMIRDITETEKLTQKLNNLESDVKIVSQGLVELESCNLIVARDLVKEFRVWIESVSRLEENKLEIHTFKGNFRGCGLFQISQALHTLEDDLRDVDGEVNRNRIETLVNIYSRLLMIVEQNPNTEAKDFNQLMQPMVSEIISRVHDNELAFEGVEIVDHVGVINNDESSLFRQTIGHIITNSLDHGYLFPRSRGVAVRPYFLKIIGIRSGQSLKLSIRDRGNGIDRENLPQVGGNLEQIFNESVTTATVVSQTSGRGIGLSAVKKALESKGGTVSVNIHPDGTEFTITINSSQLASAS